MFACGNNSEGLDAGMYYPATKSAYAEWFPQLEYDSRRPYTCVVTYWASELIYRAGIMSQEEAWQLPFDEKLRVIEQWNPYFEDQPEGTTVDKSIHELYSHVYKAVHNYPGMDFTNADVFDMMYETEEYHYVMCKLEAMHWKEFGRPETGLDESDNGSGNQPVNPPVQTEARNLRCARYTGFALWSKNTVRYRYSKAFENTEHKGYLESAMEEWRKASDYKISFKKIKNNGWNMTTWGIGCNYHVFVDAKSDRNYDGKSSLGMVPWAFSYFSESALTGNDIEGTYLHELGLCLIHEHQRPDRDEYINIYMGNIPLSYKSQFWKNPLYKSYGSFDVNSIMMYGSRFNTNERKNILAMRKKCGTEIK